MPDAAVAWSLERRLRHGLLALLFVFWLAASAAMLSGVWRETTQVLDSALAETAERLVSLPDAALENDSAVAQAIATDPPDEHVIYQLLDERGQLRLRSHSAPTTPLQEGKQDGIREIDGRRVLALTRADGRRRALVADTVAHRRQLLWANLGWLVAALAAVLVLTAWALRVLLARAFDSLDAARFELSARVGDDLRPLADSAAPAELKPWLAAVNALMRRVRSMLDAERGFAAQAAHELRTPLAAARAQAQRLALVLADGEARQHVEALVRQLDRLTALTARLLQLARIESGVALQRQPVDLAQLADLVADEYAAARRDGALVVHAQPGTQKVAADVDALGIALRNLVENGLKHGRAPVRIEVGPNRLTVSDSGPGVEPAQLASLVRPFVRGTGAAAEGAGLGLTIVDRIARQSGAVLELGLAPPGQATGLIATLRFGAAKGPAL